ncbi:hypothetical protein A1507_06600 [Methylomonas koyamae]|uniref:Uncharacterized protein n=1 Tax=Methylomonas koyamae TaxID=702114 RepID=A0A177NQA7_9GAMM|nr:hypothetical protein A1507_06600 [Methylomonas koyamae]
MQFLNAIEFMIRLGLQSRQAASANGRLAEARMAGCREINLPKLPFDNCEESTQAARPHGRHGK